MKNKVTQLHLQQIPDASIVIAIVFSAVSGEATRLQVPGDSRSIDVLAHLSGVPFLKEQDQVLIQIVDGKAVVTGRVRSPGERPPSAVYDEEGVLEVRAQKGISLRCGESCIEIQADGRITIDGREVRHRASGRLQIQGGTVEVN